MKKYSFAQWMTILLSPISLVALPQGERVVSGDALFYQENNDHLKIVTSDKAIIAYDSFNIAQHEKVQFIQPDVSASVLNRIVGHDPSLIQGNLSSNGKVFLVNPSGVFFTADARVDVGSLIVSTLDIADQDFLNDKLVFSSLSDNFLGYIQNQGYLSAEQSIVLLSSQIKNEGTILANAGKVVLASGESVTLSFLGDQLISFAVEGQVKDAMIEHLGSINATQGEVSLHLETARRALHDVINMQGQLIGDALIQENGVIRIVESSSIKGNLVHIEADHVHLSGQIDASDLSFDHKGGSVFVLGDHISLEKAKIDVSGDLGGGVVLVGGDYQGLGDVRRALTTSMDRSSTIVADAIRFGDGGSVILWSDVATKFNGVISARGGALSGDGGFVETSSKGNLQVLTGKVDGISFFGNAGTWLLDPATINVVSGGTGSLVDAANCSDTTSTFLIDPSTINASLANVTLCASTSITVTDAITIAANGVGIEFKASSGTIVSNLNANITTNNGAVTFTDSTVALGAPVTISTGTGNITFNNTIEGAQSLTVTSTGTKTFSGAVGGTAALTSLTSTGAGTLSLQSVTTTGAQSYNTDTAVTLSGTYTTTNSAFSVNTGAVTLGASTTISSGSGGITFGGAINATSGGAQTLSISGGPISLAGLGATTNLGSVSITGTTVNLGGVTTLLGSTSSLTVANSGVWTIGNYNITAPGGIAQTGAGTTTLAGAATLNTTNTTISFATAINGANNLTLNSGTGAITFTGAVGNSTRVGTLTISNAGNITASAGITAASLIQSASTGTATYGALNTNTSGGISLTGTTFALNGAITTTSSGPFTLVNSGVATIAGAADMTLAGAFSQSGGGSVSTAGDITATNSNISFANAVTFTGAASLNAGSAGITFSSTAAAGANALTLSANSFTFSSTVSGTSTITLQSATTSTSIGVAGGAGACQITSANIAALTDGFSAINIGALTGTGTITVNSVTFTDPVTIRSQSTGGTIIVNGQITGTGNASVTLNGFGTTTLNANIVTSARAITLNNSIILGANVTFDTTNGGASPGGAAVVISGVTNATSSGAQALTITAGTAGVVSLTGVGGTTPLGNVTITGNTVNLGGATTLSEGTSSLTVTNAGVWTIGTYTITAPGGITQNGAGTTTLSGNAVLNTTNGPITFATAINGTSNLTINAELGTVFLTGLGTTTNLGNVTIVGGMVNLGGTTTLATGKNLTVTNTSAWTIGGYTITAPAGITQNGIGTTILSGNATLNTTSAPITFNGVINGDSSGGQTLTMSGGSIFLGGLGATTNLGSVSITGTTVDLGGGVTLLAPTSSLTVSNSGVWTIGNFTLTAPGGIAQTGAGTTTLAGAATLNTTNTTISFATAINGANNFTLNSGTGAITLTGAVGNSTRVGTLTISSAGNITASAGITAASLIQSASTGTATYGALNTNTSGGISLTGTTFALNGAITTTSSGPFTLVNSGVATIAGVADMTLAGAFSQSGGGSVSTAGDITATNSNISFTNAVTFTGATSLNAGSAGITFSSTAAAGANSLTLRADSFTFSSTVSGTSTITLQPATASNSVGVAGAAGTCQITTANIGALSDGFSGINIGASNGTGTITINSISFSDPVTIRSPSSGGAIVVNGQITGTGNATITLNGSGAATFNANIVTSGRAISVTNGAVLGANVTFDTTNGGASPGGAAISIGGTTNATTAGVEELTIRAGTAGAVSLTGAVGNSTRVGTLTISSAGNITASAGITAASLIQSASTGTATYGVLNTNTSGGISLTGTTFALNGAITTTSSGPFTLVNSGVATIAGAADMTLAGAFSQSGGGSVSTAGDITTTNSNISFTNAVTFTGTTSLNAGSAGITFSSTAAAGTNPLTLSANSFTFSSTVSGTSTITLQPATASNSIGVGGGTGACQITTGNIGALSDGFSGINIGASNGTGTITINSVSFSDPVTIRSPSSGGAIIVNGQITGTGNATITIDGPGATTTLNANIVTSGRAINISDSVILGTNVTLDTTNGGASSGGAAITIGGTTNATTAGVEELTIRAGTAGAVSLTGAVGNSTRVGTLTISSAGNITASAGITAATLIQSASTGTATYGVLNTNTSGGISLTGTTFALNGTITTTSSGPFTLVNSGLATIAAAATMSIGSAFSQSGGGSVSIAGAITTGNANISFTNPVTLTGVTTLNAGNAEIIFSSTAAAGANALTLTANAFTFSSTVSGTSTITLQPSTASTGIGIADAMGACQITSLNIAALADGFSSIIIGDPLGNGTINIDSVTFTDPVIIRSPSSGGEIFVDGQITGTGNASITIDGPGATTTLNANIVTSGQTINISDSVILGTNIILDTTNGGATPAGANVTISGVTNATSSGAQALTITAGTAGAVSLTGAGGITPLANVAITGNTVNLGGATTLSGGTSSLTVTNAGVWTIGNYTITAPGGIIQNGAQTTTLSGNATLNTTNTAITFATAINGGNDLTLNAGTGSVSLTALGTGVSLGNVSITGGAVSLGGTTTLAATKTLTVTNSDLWTIGAYTVTAPGGITQNGSGKTRLSGNANLITTNTTIGFATEINGANDLTLNAGAGSISLAGIGSEISVGSVSITGGAVNLGAATTLASTKSLTVNNSGTWTIGGYTIAAPGGITQSGSGTTTLGGAATLNTTNTTISFATAINGANNLTLNSGTGAITFTGAVGNSTRVGTLTISNAGNITASAGITAASLIQSASTGTATYGALNTNTSGGISLTGTTFALNGTITTTSLGPVTLVNSGVATIASGSNMILQGAFTQSGGGSVSTAGNIITINSDISFSSAVTLTGEVSLDAGTAAVIFNSTAAAGANALTLTANTFTFGGTVSGTSSLLFRPGNPNNSIGIAGGTGDCVISSANIAALDDGFSGITIGALSGTGTIIVDAVTFTDPITIRSPSTGGAIIVNGPITGTGNASVTLIGPGTTTTLNADIVTDGQPIVINDSVILGMSGSPSSITLNTTGNGSTAGAAISITGTVNDNSVGSTDFVLTAGTSGGVTLGGAIGGTTPIKSITLTAGGTSSILGVKTTRAQTYNGNSGGILTLNGTYDNTPGSDAFSVGSSLAILLGGNTTVTTDSGAISFGSTINGAQTLTVTSTGAKTFSGAVGGTTPLTSLTSIGAGTLSLQSVTTTTAQTYSTDTAVTLNGTYTTTNNAFSVTAPVTLGGNTTVTVGNGNVSFANTINGASALAITTTGSTTFSAAVGGSTSLSSVSVTSGTITQSSTLTATGAVSYTNSGLATISGIINSLSFNQDGAGNVSLNADLTASSLIHFAGSISFSNSITVNCTGSGGIVLDSTMIPTSSNVYNLTLSATNGILTTQQLGSPSSYIDVAVLTGNPLNTEGHIYANTIITNGGEIINEDIIAPGANLVFSSPTTVTSGIFTINVAGGTAPGSVTFNSTLEGPGGLTFIVGAGTLAFNSIVGGETPLGDTTITSAQNVSISSDFSASSLVQVSGAGFTSIEGTLRTSNSTGVSLTGNIVSVSGPIITTNSGPVTFVNSGLLTLSNNVTSNGPFSQSGGGDIYLGTMITMTGGTAGAASVNFTNPITLIDTVGINTSSGGGSITFGASSTINGFQNFSLTAGSGNILFNTAIGGVEPIGPFTVYSAANLTLPITSACSITQVSGTGTTTIGGAVVTTCSTGVVFVTNVLNVNEPITTLGQAPITLNNSGVLTVRPGAAINAGGSFYQRGTGSVVISDNVTSHD